MVRTKYGGLVLPKHTEPLPFNDGPGVVFLDSAVSPTPGNAFRILPGVQNWYPGVLFQCPWNVFSHQLYSVAGPGWSGTMKGKPKWRLCVPGTSCSLDAVGMDLVRRRGKRIAAVQGKRARPLSPTLRCLVLLGKEGRRRCSIRFGDGSKASPWMPACRRRRYANPSTSACSFACQSSVPQSPQSPRACRPKHARELVRRQQRQGRPALHIQIPHRQFPPPSTPQLLSTVAFGSLSGSSRLATSCRPSPATPDPVRVLVVGTCSR